MSEWKEFRFGDVTVNYDARRVPIKSSDRKFGPYPYYGASGVIDHVDDFLFEGEYLLVAEDGENLRTRKTPIAFVATGRFWVNNHAHVVTGNARANTRYLSYVLANTDISGLLSGSTQPKLTKSALDALRIRLPCRRYQDAVVEIVNKLDDKIAVNRRIGTAYEEKLRAEFALLGLDEEGSVLLPELVVTNPKTPSIGKSDDAVYVDMAALPTDAARVVEWIRRKPKPGARFRNGDTVMARITPCLENGKTGFIDFMQPGEIGTGSTEFIVLRSRPGIPAHVSYFLARSPRFRSHAIQNMVGSSGRQRVSAEAFTGYTVNPPSRRELNEFGEAAEAAFAHMKALDAESKNLRELRDTLLPGLMSGAIRVRDAEKTVEEAL